MPMHYVAKIEIEPFPPSGLPNFQNVVAPVAFEIINLLTYVMLHANAERVLKN